MGDEQNPFRGTSSTKAQVNPMRFEGIESDIPFEDELLAHLPRFPS